MKKLLGILVLGLFLMTPSQADDIRDFQIEGISIGDSALDYLSKDKIQNSRRYDYKSDKYYNVDIKDLNLSSYDGLQLYFKENDDQYVIHGLVGILSFGKKYKECLKEMKTIEKELDNLFTGSKKRKNNKPHADDPKSKHTGIAYDVSGSSIFLQCVHWSASKRKKDNLEDNLKVSILTSDLLNWFRTEAY